MPKSCVDCVPVMWLDNLARISNFRVVLTMTIEPKTNPRLQNDSQGLSNDGQNSSKDG